MVMGEEGHVEKKRKVHQAALPLRESLETDQQVGRERTQEFIQMRLEDEVKRKQWLEEQMGDKPVKTLTEVDDPPRTVTSTPIMTSAPLVTLAMASSITVHTIHTVPSDGDLSAILTVTPGSMTLEVLTQPAAPGKVSDQSSPATPTQPV